MTVLSTPVAVSTAWAALGWTATTVMFAAAVWTLVRRSTQAIAVLLIAATVDVAAWAFANVPGWSILNIAWGVVVAGAAAGPLWGERR